MNRRTLFSSALVAFTLVAPVAAMADTVLRVGTFLAPVGVWHQPIQRFIDEVNARDAGIRLELVADPSSVNPFQLGDAVSSGVIDIAYISGSFYTHLVPEADALKNFNLPVQEVRANGALDLMDQIHRERMGAVFLGKIVDGIPLHIFTRRAPESYDLSGFNLRGTPLYRPMMTGLGANVMQMPGGEIYAAVESGVIDGYGWPLWGIGDLGLLEVTNYRLEPGFYRSEIALLANERRFDSLTEEQRAVLVEEAIEAENWFADFLLEVNEAEIARQTEAGIEGISFAEEQAADMLRMADEAAWAVIIENSPQYGEQIRDLTYRAP
ncbi:MAG: TRAP transporter substrate-binding protein DctP [Pararhodobacter sp.]|nr:TRAP transporter substrate-binding protein DctP [Pararhodobacter sp.]